MHCGLTISEKPHARACVCFVTMNGVLLHTYMQQALGLTRTNTQEPLSLEAVYTERWIPHKHVPNELQGHVCQEFHNTEQIVFSSGNDFAELHISKEGLWWMGLVTVGGLDWLMVGG